MPDAPPQVASNGSGGSPASPVQIAGNGAGSSPASPVQIGANGGGASPAAPPAPTPGGYVAEGNLTIGGTLTDGTNPVIFPLLLKIPPDLAATFGRYWTSTGIPYSEADGVFYTINRVNVGVPSVTHHRWNLRAETYSSGSAVSNVTWRSDDYAVGTLPDPQVATGWVASGSATGTPTFSGSRPAPAQIAANGTAATPAAPPAIV